MSRVLSPELKLAGACCHWPPTQRRDELVISAASGPIDWELFGALVQRNRIFPLVNDALSLAGAPVPSPLLKLFSERAQAAARNALSMARESLRLQLAFEGANLRAMILKGAPLALLAYKGLGFKESWDIDLLVAPDRVSDAIALLTELGYSSTFGHLTASEQLTLIAHAKELAFQNPAVGTVVELHWRLADGAKMLPDMTVNSPEQKVPIPGGWLRTLADEELFVYLCVHGTSHNWGRLKWLADVGAFVGQRSVIELERLKASAQKYDAARPAILALSLCNKLLGMGLETAPSNVISRALEDNVLAGLCYRKGTAEHRPYTVPWLRALAAQFASATRPQQMASQAAFLWNIPSDRASVQLRTRLSGFYHVARGPLWLARIIGRAFSRRSA